VPFISLPTFHAIRLLLSPTLWAILVQICISRALPVAPWACPLVKRWLPWFSWAKIVFKFQASQEMGTQWERCQGSGKFLGWFVSSLYNSNTSNKDDIRIYIVQHTYNIITVYCAYHIYEWYYIYTNICRHRWVFSFSTVWQAGDATFVALSRALAVQGGNHVETRNS